MTPSPPNLALADAIRDAGISMRELAHKCGLHPTTISKLVNGHQPPLRTTAYRIARVLNTTPAALGFDYGSED